MLIVELLRYHMGEIGRCPEDLLREEFLTVTGGGESVYWHGELGEPTYLLAMNGRAVDLIVPPALRRKTAATITGGRTQAA